MSALLESPPALQLGQRLNTEVFASMKQSFVGKDEIIDLLGLCLVGGENLFILGPPGTAKTALVHDLATRLEGRSFDYLLTRFTEPNEHEYRRHAPGGFARFSRRTSKCQ